MERMERWPKFSDELAEVDAQFDEFAAKFEKRREAASENTWPQHIIVAIQIYHNGIRQLD